MGRQRSTSSSGAGRPTSPVSSRSERASSRSVPTGKVHHITRGGRYYRVCGPDWDDPSDTAYRRIGGGRWNAPGAFGALYLNENLEGARANDGVGSS